MIEEELVDKKKQRWVIISFFFLSGIISATWSSRIPEIQQKLELTNAQLGTVLFAMPLGLMVGLSVAGWLISSFGSKKVLQLSAIICAFLLAIAGFASTTFLLMIVLFILGFARTIFNLSANTSALEVQKFYVQPIISTFHGVWSLACLAAAGISTLMIILYIGPTQHFLWTAVVCSILAFILIGRKSGTTTLKEKRPFFVMPDKYLFLLGLTSLCAMLCEGAMFDWSVNYFEKVVQPKKSLVTIGYISFVITMAGGRLIGDRLISRFGIFTLLYINGFLMAIGFALAALLPYLLPAAFGFLLIGLGDATLVPIVYMLAAKSKKMSATYALSSVTLIGYSGFVIGPLFIGNVSDIWGMPVAFLALCVLSLLVILLGMQVKKLVSTF